MSNQQGFRSLSTFKKELHRLKSLFATVPATLSNMLSKATIAWMTGGAQFGRAIIFGYTIAMIGAGVALALSLSFM